MSWSFDNLRYGWKIATGIALAGVTIYTISNTRWRINQVDEIEIALGVYERCLATQTATNPTYAVTPPDFVRSWYSNSYETQVVGGVTGMVAVLHTNIFTNTIGFRTDHAMMVELDANIKELVPFYVDTNSVYDGTTNIVMLTVTGLFASLQIGDHTNKFTSIPCWTNNVGQTNCTTNAATFGPWAWRNYVVAWQERYKVLNALKILNMPSPALSNTYMYGISDYGFGSLPWSTAKSQADSRLTNFVSSGWPESSTRGGNLQANYYATKTVFTHLNSVSTNQTIFNGEIKLYVSLTNIVVTWRYGGIPPYGFFDATNAPYDLNGTENTMAGSFYEWGNVAVGSNSVAIIDRDISGDASPWCDEPPGSENGSGTGRGFAYKASKVLFFPQFNYCTNSF